MRNNQEKSEHSFFPPLNRDLENESGWRVSYLDIITLLLASLIIILSVSQTQILSPISDYFQSSGETEFILTPIEEIKTELEDQLRPEIDQGKISIVRELNDLRITFNSRKLYRPGEATLIPEAHQLLDKVLNALQRTYQYNFSIDVEGHTDNTPIVESSYPSNWELSTARAANVVKHLSDLGVSENRLKASGYAYSRPLVPNEDSYGNQIPENLEKNRRIVLRIYQEEDQLKQLQKTPISDSSLNSWEDSNCDFSLQIGGYQKFSDAIQAANSTESKTRLDFQLAYHNDLYSVRSSNDINLLEAIQLQPELARILLDEEIPIIHQCDQRQWLQYQIQLGFFQHQNNAEHFISRLSAEYNIEAVSKQTNSGIKVLTPVFDDLRAVKNLMSDIKEISSLSDSFLIYEPKTVKSYTVHYHLQLASFETEKDAILFMDILHNELELKPEIQRLGSSFFVIDTSFQNWNRLIDAKREIRNYKTTSPIIHMIETPKSSEFLSTL